MPTGCAKWHYNMPMSEIEEAATLGARAGRRVHAARDARKWTQSDLARRADVSVSFINRLEAGKFKSPSVAHLEKIATTLGLRVTDLADISPLPAEGVGLRAELYALGYRPDEAPLVDGLVRRLLEYSPRQRRQLLGLMGSTVEIVDPDDSPE